MEKKKEVEYKKEKIEYNFTNCVYDGETVNERMEGKGKYRLANGTIYEGEFLDGMFHGMGVLHFPEGTFYKGTWENGKLVSGKLFYKDQLEYKESNWKYCTKGDRRFYHEILAERSDKKMEGAKLEQGIKPSRPNKDFLV